MNFNGEYFLGLDIGTDSVGYAATDKRYNLLKFKGEPMWGSHLFDPANQCADRRGFRTARRRLDRRQQRVKLVDEIFAPEVAKIDERFYIRKKESALAGEDKSDKNDLKLYFNSKEYDEKQYYKDYPTIHHLIYALMKEKDKKFDIRLINIAVDWLVAHRGHFLSDVGTDNVDKVLEFKEIYEKFISFFDDEDESKSKPWGNINVEEFGNILKMHGINAKKTAFKSLLFDGKIPADEDYFLDKKLLIDFISGSKVQCGKMFKNQEYEEELKMSISDEMDVLLPQLFDDDADLVARLAAMYDWSVLSDILSGSKYISESKVNTYEQHKKDLKAFKQFVKKYAKEKYDEVFRMADKDVCNYTAYSYNFKSVKDDRNLPKRKASKDDFYTYIKKNLKLDKKENFDFYNKEDEEFYDDMMKRISEGTFLPKQVDSDNRVIPYQVYYKELEIILENAKKHYTFLSEKDDEGYSNIEKLLSIFTFRIPYYVGPLRNDGKKTPYSWMKRKAEGKIYPWNFEDKINLDESEEEFINRMTNTCTYLPGEDVLPKWSLIYTKFMVLNEVNNIKSNNKAISVEAKQGIYNDLFCKYAKVSTKKIKDYLISNGYMQKDDVLSGLDITVKASLKSRYEFRHLIENNVLSIDEVEKIISRSTYAEDKERFKKWLKREFSKLNDEDYKYVSRLKYKDFGRLSYEFLNGIEGADNETGEIGTIMHFLWESNDNLMQILSDKYTFMDVINQKRQEYYLENKLTINQQMDEMGISNAVKRPVTRSLAVVKDVVSAVGYAPKKIFVEMARQEDEKKNRSVSRKDQILDLYKSVEEDTKELEKQLDDMGDMANNKLQSDALFLYYLQLGKCMYSGKPIDLTQLKTTKYNIDHIYPQSMVKDDSLLNNRVLVLSEINGDKKDVYPIDSGIRSKMHSYWKMLADKNLITKEKYERLTRSTPFTESEKMGFINRQLVETRQSMKAVTQLLKNLYPDTEIVYVKAKLASDFKNEFGLAPKSRIINDLHHAKDAYLNVVAGNVYNERFTKKWFQINEKYSMKTKVLFGHDVKNGNGLIWDSKNDFQTVKATYEKNNIHLTRYAFCQKGGLFDQMPMKKGQGQIPLKKGMDINKYGGYNKASASFFVVAKYLRGGKSEVSFVPVELMVSERFMSDDAFALDYIKSVLEGMNTKKIENVEMPLGKRIVKIKSVLSLDGYKVWINGKANGGKIVLLTSAESLALPKEYIAYVKKIENFLEKKKYNKSFRHDEENDGLSEEKNIKLFDMLTDKLISNHFKKMPGNQYETLINGRDKFVEIEFDKQIDTLLNCISLLKTGRAGGCDLKNIDGRSASGVLTLGANLSSCKYKDVRIVNFSSSGLFRNESLNLMELL